MSTPVAIVTGASSGIGEATARALATAGHTVYAAARRVERMAPLAAEGIHVLALDVTDDDSMVAAVAQVMAEQGRIDVLVNNAGYGAYGAVEDVPMAEARRQVEVNLLGLARMVQLVTPHLRARGSGRIVNVSSVGGRFGEPLGAWYHATKFAVEGFSDSLRLELAPHGIQVVVIQPGPIATEWGEIALESMQEASGHTAYADQARGLARMHASGYDSRAAGTPQEVAATITRAVTAGRPRARYVVPRRYAAALGVLQVLPDRAKDAVLRRATRPPER